MPISTVSSTIKNVHCGRTLPLLVISILAVTLSVDSATIQAQETGTPTKDGKSETESKKWTSPDGTVTLTLHSEMMLSDHIPKNALGFWGMNEGYTRLIVVTSQVPSHVNFKLETVEGVFKKELQGNLLSAREENHDGTKTYVFEGHTKVGGYDEFMMQRAFKVGNTFYKILGACKKDDDAGKEIISSTLKSIKIHQPLSQGGRPDPGNGEDRNETNWGRLAGQIGGACLLLLIAIIIYDRLRT